KLIVMSDDPEALVLLQELVRLMTSNAGGEGDFVFIRLKNSGAVETARILDEAFNGPKQQGGGGKGPAAGGGLGGLLGNVGGLLGGGGGGPARVERIRVVA